MNDSRRRDFLKVTGGVAVVGALAGCAGEAQEEDEEPEDEEPEDEEPEPGEPEEEPEEEEEEEQQEVEGDDLIRVAHMIPDFPDVDVYVDDFEEPVFSGLGYTDTTDYVELPEGQAQIRVTAAEGRSLVVFDETVSVPAGNTTAVALGEPEDDEPADGEEAEGGEDIGFQLEFFEDDNAPLEESINDSRLRLIHTSLDAPAVDVRVDETTVFENISFGEGEYFELPAGSYDFEVFPANGEPGNGPEQQEEPEEPEEDEEDDGILSVASTDGGSDVSLLQEEDEEPAPEEEDEELPEDDEPEEDQEEPEEPEPDEEDEELPEDDEPEEDQEEPEPDEPVFSFSASTEENSVSTAFAVGYLDAEAADSEAEFDVILTEDVVDGEPVETEEDDD